jgi:hypothetical protein
LQYDFPHRYQEAKRFSRWPKAEWDEETIGMIAEYYNVSKYRARDTWL